MIPRTRITNSRAPCDTMFAMATFSRRHMLAALTAAPALILARKSAAQDSLPEIAQGPFDGSAESLKAYQIPEWFRDAKFGIWAHWGPQSGVEHSALCRTLPVVSMRYH